MRWASSPLDVLNNPPHNYPHTISTPYTNAIITPISMQHSFSSYAWDIFRAQESVQTQKIVLYYKTNPCSNKSCINTTDCFCYHSNSDRRRSPFLGNFIVYSSQLCPNMARCPLGDSCTFSHSQLEIMYHPSRYRTKRCLEECKRMVCPFAHCDEELRKESTLLVYQQYSSEFSTIVINEPIDLDTFKVFPCTLKELHNHKRCIFYHSPNDRRRAGTFYSSERCSQFQKSGYCPQEDACPKCHNIIEQLYHSDKYKKRMCHDLVTQKYCEYGDYCCFAHSEPELKVELLHEMVKDINFYVWKFKTEWCPFIHQHNKSICVYAHNWQDFKRNPMNYSAQPCPNWKYDKYVTVYEEGCINGFGCGFSHGWKEALFHPSVYKTTPCPEMTKCHKGPDCPYYHSMSDIRCISNESNEYVFKTELSALQVAPLEEFESLKKITDSVSEAESLHKSQSRSQSFNNDSTISDIVVMDKDVHKSPNGSTQSTSIMSKKYKGCDALRSLHLESDEDNTEVLERKKLEHLLIEIGLEKYNKNFANKKVTICDLMINGEEKCKLVGISDKKDIKIIMEKVNTKIEILDHDSPGILHLCDIDVESMADEGILMYPSNNESRNAFKCYFEEC